VDVPVPEHATVSRSDAAVATTVALRAQFIASLLSFGSAEPRGQAIVIAQSVVLSRM
jgi:hypothetical protein